MVGRDKLTPIEEQAKIEIANNLKKLQNERHLTQKDIVLGATIAQSTISQYLSGRRLPSQKNLKKLADFFNVPVSDIDPRQAPETISKTAQKPPDLRLARLRDNYTQLNDKRRDRLVVASDKLVKEQEKQKQAATTNNVIDLSQTEREYYDYDFYDQAISAGTGQYLGDVQKETISLPIKVDADFVVPVYGDSMEPEYYSGDYVFVKLSIDLDDGEIGVFEYYGDAYIKQLIIDEDGAYLHSFNTQKYNDIPIDTGSDFRIIGEVVDVYRAHQ